MNFSVLPPYGRDSHPQLTLVVVFCFCVEEEEEEEED
jgi:hypothetical protein